jgi:hypothetical protein
MAKNVAITVRVPVMMTVVITTPEDHAESAIADAMHIASTPNLHLNPYALIQDIQPTGNPSYLSEAYVDTDIVSNPVQIPQQVDIFKNLYKEGQSQLDALRALSESADSRVLVMGFHSKTPEDPHVRYISAPLHDSDALKVFERVVESDKYGCVVIINANSLIRRQRVADRGGWELVLYRKNGNQERINWLPTRKDALSKATDIMQRDSEKEIEAIEIIDFTNREEGPKPWKKLSTAN